MNPELWTTHPLLAALSLLPVPLGALWMATAPGLVRRWAPGRERETVWLTWLATRPLLAVLVFGVLRHQSIDLTAFFLPQAHAAARWLVPYRDFSTAYAPLFPFLLAGTLVAGAAGPPLLFLLADLGAWRALAALDEREGRSPLGGAGWAYLAFPPVWYFTVRYAQDEALAAAFVAAALLSLRRGGAVRTALLLGLGFLHTKVLFGLLVLPFVLAARRVRAPAVAAFAVPVAIVYAALLALGARPWQPFTLEGGQFGMGPTIWRLPVVLRGWDPGAWGQLPWLVLVLGLGLVLRRRGASVAEQGTWGYAAFALLGAKFMPMYVVQWAPFVAAWVAEGGAARRRAWIAIGLLLPLAPYLDSGPLQGLFGPALRVAAVAGLLAVPAAHAIVLVQAWRGAGRVRPAAA